MKYGHLISPGTQKLMKVRGHEIIMEKEAELREKLEEKERKFMGLGL